MSVLHAACSVRRGAIIGTAAHNMCEMCRRAVHALVPVGACAAAALHKWHARERLVRSVRAERHLLCIVSCPLRFSSWRAVCAQGDIVPRLHQRRPLCYLVMLTTIWQTIQQQTSALTITTPPKHRAPSHCNAAPASGRRMALGAPTACCSRRSIPSWRMPGRRGSTAAHCFGAAGTAAGALCQIVPSDGRLIDKQT